MTIKDHLAGAECPVSRTVDQIGEWWSMLILRDAMEGISRFGDFVEHLGIAPTVLTRRLRDLTAAGLLERREYSAHPLCHDYVLTARGRELGAVLLAMAGWWNDVVEPGRRPVIVVDGDTGEEVDPVVVDARTGVRITWPRHRFAPGPAASDRARRLLGRFDPDTVAP